MWIVLLITHSLLAFLLLGAITHQTLSVWAPIRSKPGSFLARARAVPSGTYVTAVIVLYLLTAIMGGYIYTNYRIAARFTLEQGHFWKTFGAFELKEHFIALGLGVLPAYWYFWRSPDAAAFTRTRNMLTTILAFVDLVGISRRPPDQQRARAWYMIRLRTFAIVFAPAYALDLRARRFQQLGAVHLRSGHR